MEKLKKQSEIPAINSKEKNMKKTFNKVPILVVSILLILFLITFVLAEVISFTGLPFNWYNRTVGTNVSVGLDAPVLFMDFNTPPEMNSDGNITYVKDNSLYNNWGTLQP